MFLEANDMSRAFLEKVDPQCGRSKREMLGKLGDHSEAELRGAVGVKRKEGQGMEQEEHSHPQLLPLLF